ncbi:resolvase-like protein [Novosphingobium sp. ST904]|nr:resolvase-like protein [Novosphingobium sp. ST904]
MIWKLDRRGRDLRHFINTVGNLTKRGVGLKVLAGEGASIDTTTADGRLIFAIFVGLAEFERELIVERTRAGPASAHARGRHGGRPRPTSCASPKQRWASRRR